MNSHPLKWKYLIETVERSGLEDPDICIEDLRENGPCTPENPIIISGGPYEHDTNAVEASFSVITDIKNNRIIIRNHY
jgi:hypothetical protein